MLDTKGPEIRIRDIENGKRRLITGEEGYAYNKGTFWVQVADIGNI